MHLVDNDVRYIGKKGIRLQTLDKTKKNSNIRGKAMLRIHDILSTEPDLWITDPDLDPDSESDPEPAIFVSDLQNGN